jgi:hypothetical protein
VSYGKTTPKRCTDAFAKLLRDMVDKMLAAGHETVWLKTDHTDSLVYLTINPETAKNARIALLASGALCDGDLGAFDAVQVTEDATNPEDCPHGVYDLTARCVTCGHEQALDINRGNRDSEIEAIKGSAQRTVAARDDLLRRKEETIQRMDKNLEATRPLIAAACELHKALRRFSETPGHELMGRCSTDPALWQAMQEVGRCGAEFLDVDRPSGETSGTARTEQLELLKDLQAKNEDLEGQLCRISKDWELARTQLTDVRGAMRAFEKMADYRSNTIRRMQDESYRMRLRVKNLERLRDALRIENDRLQVEILRASLPAPHPLGMKNCGCVDERTNPGKDE